MKVCENENILGNIHSFETFGTLEGPGIRFVVFLQGCLARCRYCQNPDTWQQNSGRSMSAQEVFAKMEKCLPYITSSGGGITVSGGEPLLQIDFLRKLFSLCRKAKVHTAIDTSAFYKKEDGSKLAALLALTDLFIVDIKALDKKLHRGITSRELDQALCFISMLEKNKKQYWLRYVLVPGLNDREKDLKKLGKLVAGLRYCRNFEFLPYHTLGKHKWESLGLVYPLKDFRAANLKDIDKAKELSAIPAF